MANKIGGELMKRRGAKRVQNPDRITEEQLEYLISGFHLDPCPFENEEAAREAWEQHRSEIIATAKDKIKSRWAKRPTGKYYRVETPTPIPFAWWKFEMVTPKLQHSGPKPIEPVAGYWFGIPNSWPELTDLDAAMFETDAEYMQRLNIDPVTLRRKA